MIINFSKQIIFFTCFVISFGSYSQTITVDNVILKGGLYSNWGDVNLVANSDNNPAGGHQSMYFRTNPNAIRMTIANTGAVGIGTTAPAPGTILNLFGGNFRMDGGEIQHWGNMVFRSDYDNTGDAGIVFLKDGGGEAFRMHRDGYLLFPSAAAPRKIVLAQVVDNAHQFFGLGTVGSTELKYQINGTSGRHVFYAGISSSQSSELMRIQGNGNLIIGGNVGIGLTTDAQEKLQVNNGLLQLTGSVVPNNTNPGLRVGNVGTSYSWLQVKDAPLALNPLGTSYVAIGFLPGTYNIPQGSDYRLAVKGKIICEELKVKFAGNWPDYIFEDSYKLPKLEEVEMFIKENKHLPDVPNVTTIEKEGIESGAMDATLLKKIEELTLYLIEQNKKINKLEEQLNSLTPSQK